MIFPIVVICVFYSILILFLSRGFDKLKAPVKDYSDSETDFSILVPFRNEEKGLPRLLKSINSLDYHPDRFEIILIDDDSNDESLNIIQLFKEQHPELNIVLISKTGNSSSPKKEALNQGIELAAHKWIITTDADCIVPKNWLNAFDNFIRQESPKMIVAPVSYEAETGFIHKFQALDFLSLQATTMGIFGLKHHDFIQPFLCNGANLCYQKESFIQVNGYQGNEHIASGDDVFLLEKMYAEFPQDVEFLKSNDAVVLTTSKNTLKELLQQRVRWASKTVAYKHIFAKLVGVLVFLTNFSLLIGLFLAMTAYIPWLHFGFLFLLKFNIDFVLLYKTAGFFEQKEQMRSYFISSLLYPFFTVLVVLLSFKTNYTWKERKY